MARNYSIDFMKFFATLAVVVIHTDPFQNVTVMGMDGSYLNFLSDTLSRFAVPFFFVVSGYLLGSKLVRVETKEQYLKKYLMNLTKMYLSWVTFYLLYDIAIMCLLGYFRGSNIKSDITSYFGEYWSLKTFLYLGQSTSGTHLWYLTALIWSTLIIFIFYKINKINFLLIISFALNLFGIINNTVPARDSLFFGLLYTAIGFFMSVNYSRYIKYIKPRLFVVMLIIFSLLQIVERKFLYDSEYFVSTIPLTIVLFLLVLKYNQFGKGTIFSKIGRESFGIYVIHIFFINISYATIGFLNLGNLTGTLIWNLLFTPFVFVISYLTYNLLQSFKEVFKEKKQIDYKIKITH